jgi:hypothetical protein
MRWLGGIAVNRSAAGNLCRELLMLSMPMSA